MTEKNTIETKIAIFRGKKIRKTIYKNEWWFSVIDVIEALTGSDRPRKYWNDLKKKIKAEGYVEVSEKIGQLKLISSDGKKYLTDCANTETMFRIIQSISSPKAEPFKRWLARVTKPFLSSRARRAWRSDLSWRGAWRFAMTLS